MTLTHYNDNNQSNVLITEFSKNIISHIDNTSWMQLGIPALSQS